MVTYNNLNGLCFSPTLPLSVITGNNILRKGRIALRQQQMLPHELRGL